MEYKINYLKLKKKITSMISICHKKKKKNKFIHVIRGCSIIKQFS